MTAVSSVNAGSRITASMLRGVAPLAVVKGADESVTSSTTLQNDDALFLSVAANATYLFECYLNYEGGTLGSSDLKLVWSAPSGATMRFTFAHVDTSGNNVCSVTSAAGSTLTTGTNGAASLRGATMKGTLAVGATAGTLQLTWAQNTSSGTATIIHALSHLALWQVA